METRDGPGARLPHHISLPEEVVIPSRHFKTALLNVIRYYAIHPFKVYSSVALV